jgi:hypothetical protein
MQATNDTWTPFEDISNTSTASTNPCIVADTEGNVHVIWSEDVGGRTRNIQFDANGSPMLDARGNKVNKLTQAGNTLFYTRWNGQRWSDPIDIIVNPNGYIQYPESVVDAQGTLHLVWIASEGGQASLYYSRAVAGKADSAQAWQRPMVLAEKILYAYYPADIAVDSTGGLHVMYSIVGVVPGIYVISSYNGGVSWSSPVEVFRTYDTEGTLEGASPLRLISGSDGRLVATWTKFGADGNGKGVYFSQSLDNGETWSKPIQVAAWQAGWYEVDWISAGISGKEIHLVWEGNSSVAALFERISYDGGQTWGESTQILPTLVGENGFADLVADSANKLHLLVVKRGDPDSITNGIWYTSWESDHWQDPTLLGTALIGLYPQLGKLTQATLQDMMRDTFTGNGLRYQRSTIVNGNELFVVVVNEWDGDIWASHTTLDAPRVDNQAYPQPTAVPTRTPVATPVPTATVVPISLSASGRAISNPGTEVGNPVLAGSVSVLVIVAAVALYVRIHKQRRT